MRALGWILGIAAACGAPKSALEAAAPAPPATSPPVAAPPQVSEATVDETIEETTVGELSGRRVGMANVFEDTYTLPDGTAKTGLTCLLSVFDVGKVRVGEGSVFEVAGDRWLVVGITKVSGENGEVALRRLPR